MQLRYGPTLTTHCHLYDLHAQGPHSVCARAYLESDIREAQRPQQLAQQRQGCSLGRTYSCTQHLVHMCVNEGYATVSVLQMSQLEVSVLGLSSMLFGCDRCQLRLMPANNLSR